MKWALSCLIESFIEITFTVIGVNFSNCTVRHSELEEILIFKQQLQRTIYRIYKSKKITNANGEKNASNGVLKDVLKTELRNVH